MLFRNNTGRIVSHDDLNELSLMEIEEMGIHVVEDDMLSIA